MRQGRLLGICAALASTMVLVTAGAAQANVGGFDAVNGSESVASCLTQTDWACLSSSDLISSLENTPSTSHVFSNSKENDPDNWVINTGEAGTPKAQINANWAYSFTSPDFSTNYIAMAFQRASGTGESYLAFELNQSGSYYTNSQGTRVPCRRNGDVLISFTLNGGTTSGFSAYAWKWTSGTPCTRGATGSFSTPVALNVADAEQSVNTGPIANDLSTGALGTTFVTGTFGEVAINLNALVTAVKPPYNCEFFNHLQLTSRSSSSITSNMEAFVDDGASVFASACQSTGGGGGTGGGGTGGGGTGGGGTGGGGTGGGGTGGGGSGGGTTGNCTVPASVAISSPLNGYTDLTHTVDLAGTTNQPQIEVLDGTHVVGNPVVSSGHWTLHLSNVPNGAHAYTAVARTTDCTAHYTVDVTVNAPHGGGGGGGGGTGGTGAVAPCLAPRLRLNGIYPGGGRVHLLGTAPRGSAGKTVAIVSMWNHKVLTHVTVAKDLTFGAAVKLPPRKWRYALKVAYKANMGSQWSNAERLRRRLYDTSLTAKGRRVTFTGIVTSPLTKPKHKVIVKIQKGCGVKGGVIVARATVRHGKFKVRFTVPKKLAKAGVITIRASTVVLKSSHTHHVTRKVYGLPRSIRV